MLVRGQIYTLVVWLLQEIKAQVCKIRKLTAVIKYSQAHLHQRESTTRHWNTKIIFTPEHLLLTREPRANKKFSQKCDRKEKVLYTDPPVGPLVKPFHISAAIQIPPRLIS